MDNKLEIFLTYPKGMRMTTDQITTPLGKMIVGVTDAGLCLLEFFSEERVTHQIRKLNNYLEIKQICGTHEIIDTVKKQLEEYFLGKRKYFDVPLVIPGSIFQQKVWQSLMQISYGITQSYKQQANNIGNVKAVRAVAKANGENRISIILPCHRIIGSNGGAVGYAGGMDRKQWLIKHEFENR